MEVHKDRPGSSGDDFSHDALSAELPSSLRALRAAVQKLGVNRPDELERAIRGLSAGELERLSAAAGSAHDLAGRAGEITRMIESIADSHGRITGSFVEKGRPAREGEPQRIEPGRVAVVTKLSKFDLDMQLLGLSPHEMIERYKREGVDLENIISSHETQAKSRRTIEQVIPASRIAGYHDADSDLVRKADLVISLGGDDHFKYVSHFVNGGFIAGVNSDPLLSDGALTSFNAESFAQALERLRRGDFEVQEWTRLEVRVNGAVLPPACSEIALGEENFRHMSRGSIIWRGEEIRFKGSPLIVATGAGSTGWAKSGSRYLHFGKHIWPRTEARAEWVVSQPHGDIDGKTVTGELLPGEELVVISSHNHSGKVSSDSVEEMDFPRGARAVVRISDRPLKVIK